MENGKRMHLDGWIALLLAVVTLICSVGMLDRGHDWGDDFAGYILEGQAIAEGRLEEQCRLNAVMHPSERAFGEEQIEALDDSLVYVWGLPVILSGISRLVGYDRPEGRQILYYKLPGVCFLALTAAVLYLFNRRRFSRTASFFLTALLVLNREVIAQSNVVMTDVPCLFGSVLTLYLLDRLLDEEAPRRRAGLAIALGAAMFLTCAMRLNGVTLVYAALLAQGISLFQRKGRGWKIDLLPYVTLGLLWGFARLFLPAVTSNTSDVGAASFGTIFVNLAHYHGVMVQFVSDMLPGNALNAQVLVFLLYGFALAGCLTHGWGRNLHLLVLLAGTAAVLLLLPYYQELRYVLNVLPILLLFAAYGMQAAGRALAACWKKSGVRRGCTAVGLLFAALLLTGTAQHTIQMEMEHVRNGGFEARGQAYGRDALELYRFVSENTQEDDVIGFAKPRVLYLNTGRVSMMPGINGNLYRDLDYLIAERMPDGMYWPAIWPELMAELTPVKKIGSFEIFSVSQAYQSGQ